MACWNINQENHELEIQELIQKIRTNVKENIAREIKPLLRLLVPTVCHGCVFDCPGQLDHDVCMDPETIGAFGKLLSEAWERLKIKTLVQDGDLVRDVMMENMVDEDFQPTQESVHEEISIQSTQKSSVLENLSFWK